LNRNVNKYYRLNAYLHVLYYKHIKSKKYSRIWKTTFNPNFTISGSLNETILPKNKILFLHVGLRKLAAITNKSYQELSEEIIDNLIRVHSPYAIIVPTFTWSFRKTGIYSVKYSRSEAGMFSEIFRKIADYRTPNAIQSFSIISNDISAFSRLNHLDTFANDGIYEYFRKNETYIIDVATDTFRASPLHHIERVCNVCYLKSPSKSFKGIIIDKDDNIDSIDQLHGGTNIYNGQYIFNKEKIEKFLIRKNLLKVFYSHGIKISTINNQDLHRALESRLKKNPFFAITF